MNAFDIEAQRQNLLVNLPIKYGRSKVYLFYDFYASLLNSSEKSLIEAYLLEFIEEYINSVQHFSPYCIPPARTVALINQLKEISNLPLTKNFEKQIAGEIGRINRELTDLESILYGNEKNEQSINMLSFPLIEENTLNKNSVNGFLETVRVTVNKSKGSSKLYVFPNKGELEKNLEKQIKDSFLLALKYLKKFNKKFHDYHEIIVYFDNFSANYIGNSLGIALTIGFIEQLTILYNLPFLVNIKNNISSTGGINSDGKILSVAKENIEKKVEIVFYSAIEIFIVPKEDEQDALEKLYQLKELYPQRNLKIMGVTDLDDITDRRNLIDISKQNPIVRTFKVSIRNWQVTLLIIILYLIIAVTLFRSFDNNPAVLENHEKILLVKNKDGKILWTKHIGYNPLLFSAQSNLDILQKIVDIDNDGTNEVIITNESAEELRSPDDYGRISCFSSEGKLIWSYKYQDSVSISGKSSNHVYFSSLIDTFSLGNQKYLLSCAHNITWRISVITKINLQNGIRSGGVLSHDGLINNALIYDFNNDGIKEAAFASVNNYYKKVILGIIDLSELSGKCPTNDNNFYNNFQFARLNTYLLFPKNIYENHNGSDNGQVKLKDIINSPAERSIYLSVVENNSPISHLTFKIYYDWQTIEIIDGINYNRQYDSSATKEKKAFLNYDKTKINKLLKNDVMYWTGKDFARNNR